VVVSALAAAGPAARVPRAGAGLAVAVCVQLSFQCGTALATADVSTLLTNLLPVVAGVTIFGGYLPGGGLGVLRGLGFAAAVLEPSCSAADRRRLLLSRTGRPDSDRRRLMAQAG